MRPSVDRFLQAAASHLDLHGPVALLRSGKRNADAADWMRRQFTGELMLDCRVANDAAPDEEIELGALPIEEESLRTLLCVDLLRRYEETAGLLAAVRPLLAPGGIAILTADVSHARPQEGLSRVLTPLGIERLVADFDAAIVGWQGDIDFPHNLFLVACEFPAPDEFAASAGRFINAYQSSAAGGPVSRWGARLWNALRRWSGRGAAATSSSGQPVNFLLHLPKDADWKEAIFDRAPRKRAPPSRLDAR